MPDTSLLQATAILADGLALVLHHLETVLDLGIFELLDLTVVTTAGEDRQIPDQLLLLLR